ncbi:MAG: GAF domain-containing protein [Chryseolinea sp.]
MKMFLSDNWIILVIGIFLMASMSMAIRNNYVIEKNHELQQQAELIHQRTQDILSKTMHGLDLGVRGFGLTKNDAMLRPYIEAIQTSEINFRILDSLLQQQKYSDRKVLAGVKAEIENYMYFSKGMVDVARAGNMEEFIRLLDQDKGYEVWKKYAAFSEPLFKYEVSLNKEARITYQAAMRANLYMQISILLLAIPLLYLFIVQIRKERDARSALLKKVEENDRTFVFNSGVSTTTSANEINDNSIQHVKEACQFIAQMADGNYEVYWQGLNDENRVLNNTTLAGNLIQLRDKLKTVKREDEKRYWLNQGLASFLEIVRENQHDKHLMATACVSYITKYLGAQQAGLFVVEDDELKNEKYLSLVACYAFNKKKYIDRRVNIGEGIVGQTYLEQEPVHLKFVPPGYTHITSGLGEATPSNLLVVPFKYESSVAAVIEIASFVVHEDHHIEFVKKAGEYLASAITNAKITEKMRGLLESSSMSRDERNYAESA